MSHAALSPSTRHRWGNCPGSVREERAYPDSSSGLSAIEGTHSHTLLEQCIRGNLVDPHTRVGHLLTDHEGEFTVDNDRADRVAVAVNYVRERSMGGLLPVLAEQRVNPAPLLFRDDLHGTVDVQIHGMTDLEIIDYKDGMRDAWDSALLQMEQYAVGVLAGLRGQHTFETVKMTVIQPKLAFKGLPAIRSVERSVEEILGEVAREILVEAGRASEPDAPLVPGDLQCKWCRHKGACPALAKHALDVIAVTGLVLDAAQKEPTVMSDQQLVEIMEAAPLVRQLLEGVEAEALRRMKAGQTIPGLKLINGRGSRAWALPEEEMAQKLVRLGIPKGEVYESKMISPAKAEKLRWKKKDGTEVQLSARQLKTMKQEYVVNLVGALTVALDADHRPAVSTDASSLFGAVNAAPVVETSPLWLTQPE